MTHARFVSFWRFALRTYRKPGVEAACLALQDQAGADIPVILLLLYASRIGCGVLTHEELRRVIETAEPWAASVVRPLRQLRRDLKKPVSAIDQATSAPLRTAVKRLELNAERMQMAMLVTLLPDGRGKVTPAARRHDAYANSAAYLSNLGRPGADEGRVILNTLIEAALRPRRSGK